MEYEYTPGWGSHQPHIIPAWPVIVKVIKTDKEEGWAPALTIEWPHLPDTNESRP